MNEDAELAEVIRLIENLARLRQMGQQDRDPVAEYLASERQRKQEENRGGTRLQVGTPPSSRTMAGASAGSGTSGMDKSLALLGGANTVSGLAGGPTIASLLAGAK